MEEKKEEIKKLQDELKESKIIIQQLNDKIMDLETKLQNENNKFLNKIKELENNIILKNNELNDLKAKLQSININQIEKNNNNTDKCISFILSDYKIVFGIPCSGTSTFAEVEELLYKVYPEYRETNNLFLADGKEVLRFKTIDDNKIGIGKPVMLTVHNK